MRPSCGTKLSSFAENSNIQNTAEESYETSAVAQGTVLRVTFVYG